MKSPWAWLRDLVGNVFARRNGQDPIQFMRFVLPYPVAGLNLLPDDILSLATVWACIDIIAKSIGSCRWNIYQPTGHRRRDLLLNDPVYWVLNVRPNPEMTAIAFREGMMLTAIPFGNAYAEIVRDQAGRVSQLWPLPQDRVTPKRDRETWELLYEYLQPDGSRLLLKQRDVFHLKGPGLNGLLGDNIIARATKSMAVAAAQERHAASYFGQGANPGGVLKYPGQLSKERYDRLKEDWTEKKKGPENAHKPMILEEGMTWEGSTADAQKSQLVESRQFSVEEICRWFGVPPHKVQHLLRATFSNIEHQSIEFVRDALNPWCRRLEQEADYKLFRQDRAPFKESCIDTMPLTLGDMKSRAEGYGQFRQNGVMTANEIREREGLDDAGPDGDVLLVNGNMKSVEQVLNPPAPPAPALPPGKAAGTDGGDANTGNGEAGTGDDEAGTVARQALGVILAGALERYARRLSNRRTDLARKLDPAAVTRCLDAEHPRLWARLLADVAPAEPFAALALGRAIGEDELRRAAELVESGEAAPVAAAKALPASCPQPS